MLIKLSQAIKTAEAALIEAQVHFGHGTDNAWDEAVFLVLGACGMPLDTQKDQLQNVLPSKKWQIQNGCRRAAHLHQY